MSEDTVRKVEELEALKEWESDTGKPASASEGNAFIDGFYAGRKAGRSAMAKEAAQLCVKWRAAADKDFLALAKVNAEHQPEWATELETNMNDLRQCAEELIRALAEKENV